MGRGPLNSKQSVTVEHKQLFEFITNLRPFVTLIPHKIRISQFMENYHANKTY